MERGLEVYVVDDNKDAADSLRDVILRLGHNATSLYDGAAALQAARQAPPDCVLLDVAMSGMNGLELARALRAEFGDDVVLVAVTGAPEDDEVVAKTFETVDHYFVKPVSLDKLMRLLPHA